ncbi:MAG: hypothetical protein EP330_02235 [Deltaproteobacteria bacterium]|nr:MAG: hypothetical protein EP330_02235 [Deltaproteobacteria bacterium]
MRVLLIPVLLAGCTLGGLTPVDEGSDEGSDTGSSGDTGSAQSFDPYDGLGANAECDDFDGTPYTGATGYFVGEFTFSDGLLTGYEDWILYPNQSWSNMGQGPCYLRWNAFGTVSGPVDCVGCSHEIVLDLTFDGETSNCPQNLEDIEGNDGNVTYYVQASPNGTARFEFTDGDFLGNGVLIDGRAAYVSDPQCNVF